MDIDDADELAADASKGFWKRQFDAKQTRRQKKYDWLFGVVMPTICIAADPFVFRTTWWSAGTLLGSYRPFAYLLSFVSIMAMAAWLLWGARLKWLAAPMAGLFLVGGSISLVVGIVLFPFSLFGLVLLIGALGFTPLFSSVIYLRNGIRAYRVSRGFLDDQAAWQAAFLAGLFSFIVPYVVNFQVTDLVRDVAKGDVNTIRHASSKLRFVAPLADPGPIFIRYRSSDPEERQSLRMKEMARVYKELTGSVIEPATPFDF